MTSKMVRTAPANRLTMAVLPHAPGKATRPTEPGTWSVMGMLVGSEEVAVYDRDGEGFRERRRFHVDVGIVASLPDGSIFATGNAGAAYSIELRLHGLGVDELPGTVW